MQPEPYVDSPTVESHFCMPQGVNDPPLPEAEEAHRIDFLADEAHPVPSVLFGTIFRVFCWVLLIGAPVPSFQVPEAKPPLRLENLRQKTELFDRLADHYGDRYRGGVILIYLLGWAAVMAALTTAIAPELWHRAWVGVELAILVVILGIHMRGRSAPSGAHIRSGSRFRQQRWHERWIDYRGLAERFRYAELRIGIPATTQASESDDWCTRYFNEEFARAAASAGTVTHRARILSAAIYEQQQYHRSNAHICNVLSRRLQRWTVRFFLIALAGVLVELAFGFSCLFPEQGALLCRDATKHCWLYLAVGLPAFAAALHGIESSCEWSKLARSSTSIARALDELRTKLEALLKCGHDMAGQDDGLDSLITRFLQVTTDEATGWRATLWDKNVPLAV